MLHATLTANETASVDEDAAFDTGEPRQLVVADTTPLLGERLTAFKALGGDGDGLNTPVASGLVWVEDINGFFGVGDLKSFFEFKEVFLHPCHEERQATQASTRAHLPRSELLEEDDTAILVNLPTLFQSRDDEVASG